MYTSNNTSINLVVKQIDREVLGKFKKVIF